MLHSRIALCIVTLCLLAPTVALPQDTQPAVPTSQPATLERIVIAPDGTSFITEPSGTPFVAWGVNYDHDYDGLLLEDYWVEHWDTVVEDFHEIKALGANVVRIHLQVSAFMNGPDKPNEASLAQLAKLVTLAEDVGLYLDLTGLGCYHKQAVPAWYVELSEADRWKTQAAFWEAVAEVGAESPAIFFYDLMNEPILPGGDKVETDWLGGAFAGKYFVQRISLDLAGRTREQVAKAWVDTLVAAIRKHDEQHLITVGVIPWAHVWPTAKPLFYSPEVGENLDFVSVHFYPKKGEVEKALVALKVYDIGKPLVIEEMFPLSCGADELLTFIDSSRSYVDGYISFYWGWTAEEYRNKEGATIGDAIVAEWLGTFEAKGREVVTHTGQAAKP
ncbi:MAG: hypothetical protein D8M59_05905 [Planctomycetes bacterium]|nr:hypothetical protein [Planctomycetota bacterium]NOG55883.1 cellulase family glycosylhydrolase [Planctomycetota bacterium]